MNRLEILFSTKKHHILNVYGTAGFPKLNSTLEMMRSLQECGADMMELGMPYSDPLADGPVIQHSNAIALSNGMTMQKLFAVLKDFRKEIHIPVILMGYLNPVLQFGFEKFCAAAASVGIDGLIIPDLPEFEFEKEYGAIIKKYGLSFSFLVTPETPDVRVKKLDSLSSGFLYAVSASATTGGNTHVSDIASYLSRLQLLNLKNPVLVGFGIKDKNSFNTACRYAQGAIIGSAYIAALGKNENVNAATKSFLSSITG